MEVSLYVIATEAPGLDNKRSSQVKKVLRVVKQKEEKLNVDVTKSPVDLKLYETVLSWFPAEEQQNVINISTQVAGKTVDVSKPLDLKSKSDVVYYVLVK